MKKLKDELLFRLLLGVIVGLGLGFVATAEVMSLVLVVKDFLEQLIFFTVPLIILGFIAPSIATLSNNATKMLTAALVLAYSSTLGAALMSMIGGYILVPCLNIPTQVEGLTQLPPLVFSLSITPIMPVMSALVLSLLLGLGVSATKSKNFENLLMEFQNVTLFMVTHMVIPLLPFFIGTTFAALSYEGAITKQLPVFFVAILIAILGHLIWLMVLYSVAGLYAKVNPKEVYRHYLPAYFTAVGTMSSAATLPVSLSCAKKSSALSQETINFGVPLFSNIHLCGSVLTEVFFVMVVSQMLYGALPALGSTLIFVFLLGIFGIGAPGVPGGTVMASLGLITGVLGFDSEGTALMMTIFALQDSFGTACNVTGDGALTLMLEKYAKNCSSKT